MGSRQLTLSTDTGDEIGFEFLIQVTNCEHYFKTTQRSTSSLKPHKKNALPLLHWSTIDRGYPSSENKKQMYIECVQVDPEHREKGIGTRLLENIENIREKNRTN